MRLLERDAWRALPLHQVVTPTLDAPTLFFDSDQEAIAAVLQARIDDLHVRYRRTNQQQQRRTLALRIRKAHLLRVSLATGIRVPGRRCIFGFYDA